MDEFDKVIQDAAETYQPSTTFVEETMQKISSKPVRSKHGLRLWLPMLISGLAVVALIFVALPVKNRFFATTDNTARTSTSQDKSTKSTGQAATGTDDASLNSDLSSIGTAMNQESSDQDTANGALNDSAEQITVPTE
jgi:cytoskeletal protein RodZ